VRLNVRRADGYAVVEVSGHVDISSSPELRQACLALVRARTPAILFDMRDVNYLDSSGIATLVECLQRLGDYDGSLGLFGLTDRAREIFEVTNLTRLFKFYDSEEEAVRSVQ
jgi:anti-sigma B factor antagonist